MESYLKDIAHFIEKSFDNTNHSLYFKKVQELLVNDQWLQTTLACRDGLAKLYNITSRKQFANFLHNFNRYGRTSNTEVKELEQLDKFSLFLVDVAEYFEPFAMDSKKAVHLPQSKKKSTFDENLLKRKLVYSDNIDTLPSRLNAMFAGTICKTVKRFPKLFSESDSGVEKESTNENLARLYNNRVEVFNNFVKVPDSDFGVFVDWFVTTIANLEADDVIMHEYDEPLKSKSKKPQSQSQSQSRTQSETQPLTVQAIAKWPSGQGVIFYDMEMNLLYIQRGVLEKEKGGEGLVKQLKSTPVYTRCKKPYDLSRATGKYTLMGIPGSKKPGRWIFASIKGHGLGRFRLTGDRKEYFSKLTSECKRIDSLEEAIMDEESEAELDI